MFNYKKKTIILYVIVEDSNCDVVNEYSSVHFFKENEEDLCHEFMDESFSNFNVPGMTMRFDLNISYYL